MCAEVCGRPMFNRQLDKCVVDLYVDGHDLNESMLTPRVGCQVMINSRLIDEGGKHVNSNSAPAPFHSNATAGIFRSFL